MLKEGSTRCDWRARGTQQQVATFTRTHSFYLDRCSIFMDMYERYETRYLQHTHSIDRAQAAAQLDSRCRKHPRLSEAELAKEVCSLCFCSFLVIRCAVCVIIIIHS